MKRATLSGAIVWIMIFMYFTFLSFIPYVKDAELLQHVLLWFLLIPIVLFGLNFYHKKVPKSNELLVGVIIVITCLTLDVLITIPLTIIPYGGSYVSFFTNPFLWIIVAEILTITFVKSKKMVKNSNS